MPKPKKRPVIDRRRMTERHAKSEQRIADLKDKLAIDIHKEGERILDAVHATFNDAIWECDDPKLVRDIFALLCRSAKTSNARLIAQHPDCPAEIGHDLETRIQESRRSTSMDDRSGAQSNT